MRNLVKFILVFRLLSLAPMIYTPMFPAKNLKVSNKIPPSDSYWNTELLDGIFYFYVYMYSNYV